MTNFLVVIAISSWDKFSTLLWPYHPVEGISHRQIISKEMEASAIEGYTVCYLMHQLLHVET